jgi:hypothetical protein
MSVFVLGFEQQEYMAKRSYVQAQKRAVELFGRVAVRVCDGEHWE